jgi:hypothetical protein
MATMNCSVPKKLLLKNTQNCQKLPFSIFEMELKLKIISPHVWFLNTRNTKPFLKHLLRWNFVLISSLIFVSNLYYGQRNNRKYQVSLLKMQEDSRGVNSILLNSTQLYSAQLWSTQLWRTSTFACFCTNLCLLLVRHGLSLLFAFSKMYGCSEIPAFLFC